MDNSLPLNPDDHLLLPAVSGWHERIALGVHEVAREITKPHRPRADDVWRQHGVTVTTTDDTGRSQYASRLLFTVMSKKPPRDVPTSDEIAIVYNQLQPLVLSRIQKWGRTLGSNDVAQLAAVGIWKALRHIGVPPQLRPGRWGSTPPHLPARLAPYVAACIDNAITDHRRTWTKHRSDQHDTIQYVSLEAVGDLERGAPDTHGRPDSQIVAHTPSYEIDPTDSWCEWLDFQTAFNATCTDHPYRATLTMHAAGYPDCEIADTRTIPVRSVRQRRHELRARLRNALALHQ